MVMLPSHSAWSAWIEIGIARKIVSKPAKSHSAWSAWIEIAQLDCVHHKGLVALRMECVD